MGSSPEELHTGSPPSSALWQGPLAYELSCGGQQTQTYWRIGGLTASPVCFCLDPIKQIEVVILELGLGMSGFLLG